MPHALEGPAIWPWIAPLRACGCDVCCYRALGRLRIHLIIKLGIVYPLLTILLYSIQTMGQNACLLALFSLL